MYFPIFVKISGYNPDVRILIEFAKAHSIPRYWTANIRQKKGFFQTFLRKYLLENSLNCFTPVFQYVCPSL